MLVQPSGNIVLAGSTQNPKGGSHFAAAELNSGGSLVSSFGSGGTVVPSFKGKWTPYGPSDAVLYPPTDSAGNEKILEAGWAVNSSGQGAFALVRYNSNGSLDTSFGSGGLVTTTFPPGSNTTVVGVILVPNGSSQPKILAVGQAGSGFAFARYNPNGSLDTTFGSGGTLYISSSISAEAAALDPVNGDLIVVGEPGSGSGGMLAAFKPTTNAQGTVIGYSFDSPFGGSGLVQNNWFYLIRGLTIQPDGNIVVAGQSPTNTPVQNTDAFAVARYKMDGTLDTTFNGTGEESTWFPNPTIGALANSVVIQSDGKIVVGGQNATGTVVGHQFALVRYNSDGSLDTSFGTSGIVTTTIGSPAWGHGLALQPNGEILEAGSSGSQWAVARYLASDPLIGSFTANPNPVTSGSSTTLTAANITDANPGATVTQVAFYLDSNGDGTLEPGTDQLLGYATQTSPGVWTFTFTVNLAPGTYTLFAQAQDNYGVLGDPVPAALTVQ